ncbi:PDZ domain-containing protein [Luteolibacter flavescens]|uniref:PDZ domain-containing protein n=1 Tax=Luteolibacter flavescens TaxID=1859460 RepID=A0ABT3FRP0_9BACT|nr:PDZ domain-containing protein [Luteolibacter flavescens]MCW1886258.1 PDZ domain-containing protein [Luteolibacter flavescens]
MKTSLLATALHAALLTGAYAQGSDDVPLMRPEEAETVQRQAMQFIDAVRPSVRPVVPSTVWVWADTGSGKRSVAYGTIVQDGTKALTKWSEIAMARGPIQVVGGDGATAKAKVIGVYQEEDLALLQLDGAQYHPVSFNALAAPKLGRFLIAASPDDTPVSVGVVAVEARSLREKDQAFLGVIANTDPPAKGLRIESVEDGSAAADAGLQKGDLILSVGGRDVGGLIELKSVLSAYRPGDSVEIRFDRKGEEITLKAELKERGANFPGFPNGRLSQMERMGSKEKGLSIVREGFPTAIQTDLRVGREQCGGPVVDLDGNLVGISIARADRTRSFVIPAKHIQDLLSREPVSAEVAQAAMEEEEANRRQQVRQNLPPQQNVPRAIPAPRGAAENLRRNLEEMELLMERMRAEMDGLEE